MRNLSVVNHRISGEIQYGFALWSIWEIYAGLKFDSTRSLSTPHLIQLICGTQPFSTKIITVSCVQSLGFASIIMGGLFRIWAMKTLGRFFTFHLAIRTHHTLITDGPYRWVRHPSYTAFYFLVPGVNMVLLSGHIARSMGLLESCFPWLAGMAVLASPVSFHMRFTKRRVRNEEEVLAEGFGKEWVAYTRRTPYKTIPWVS